jgi:hypothetical protein
MRKLIDALLLLVIALCVRLMSDSGAAEFGHEITRWKAAE